MKIQERAPETINRRRAQVREPPDGQAGASPVDAPAGVHVRERAADPSSANPKAPTETQNATELLARANLCFERREISQALSLYDESLRHGLDSELCTSNRWACLMMLGDFERAWQETDRTEKIRRANPEPPFAPPPHLRRVWNGSPLDGGTVLVRCYHGLGDTIQFIRYIPMLAKRADRVLVECQESLRPLLSSIPGICRIGPLGSFDEAREYDVDVELMELPYVFRTVLETVPARVPYLHVSDGTKRLRLKELADLGLDTREPANRQLNVGVAWCSGQWNKERDVPRGDLESLFDLPDVKLFSLQRDLPPEQTQAQGSKLIETESPTGTLMDTAATISCLDLIISVDTMVAHLAGALGNPTWTLLPFRADWRWMINRNDSPWYPSMRLFRQSQPGDWKGVISCVKRELQKLARSEKPHQSNLLADELDRDRPIIPSERK